MFRLACAVLAVFVVTTGAVIAAAFFSYAFYLHLVTALTPPAAAALAGFGALVILLGIAAAARALLPRTPEASLIPLHPTSVHESAALLGEELGEKLRDMVQRHRAAAMGAVLLSGFAMGASPRLRRFAFGLIKR
jgi:hypothetical protein